MAQALNGSTQAFTAVAPFHAPTAYTAALWVNITSLATEQKMIGVWNDTSEEREWIVTTSGTSLTVAQRRSDGAYHDVSGGTIPTGTWTHIAIRWNGSTLEGFINGVSVCNVAVVTCRSTTTLLSIGAGTNGSAGTNFLGGSLAEAALWNTSLTTPEIASMAAGFSPLLVRPASRKFYMDGIRNVFDWNGAAITSVGSPAVATHPRVYVK